MSTSTLGTLRVLVIGSEPLVGAPVDCADSSLSVEHADGVAAGLARIDDLTAPPIDVIVLDLGADGAADHGVFSRVLEGTPELPIVVVTPDGASDLGRLLVRAGASDFLRRSEVGGDGLRWAVLTSHDRHEHRRRAEAERSQRVLLEERRRVARELHDQVIQRLFAMGLELERLAMIPTEDDRARLRTLARSVDSTIDDLRFAVEQLRSGDEPVALEQTLRRVAAEVQRGTTRPIRLEIGTTLTRLEPALAQAVVAVLREALTNAVKYGSGDVLADVSAGDELVIEVRAGVTHPASSTPGGHGLRNMADRAARYGGGMDFSVDPGVRSALRWWVPLTATNTSAPHRG